MISQRRWWQLLFLFIERSHGLGTKTPFHAGIELEKVVARLQPQWHETPPLIRAVQRSMLRLTVGIQGIWMFFQWTPQMAGGPLSWITQSSTLVSWIATWLTHVRTALQKDFTSHNCLVQKKNTFTIKTYNNGDTPLNTDFGIKKNRSIK
jgi:hypothetical protein